MSEQPETVLVELLFELLAEDSTVPVFGPPPTAPELWGDDSSNCPACGFMLPLLGEFPNQVWVKYPNELLYDCPHCGARIREIDSLPTLEVNGDDRAT